MQAQVILRGPENITWHSELKDEPSFYGWPVLSFETVTATLPAQVESRSIYAHLYDKTQPFAILRAVFLDWKSTREAFREQGENFQLTLPARFIKLPIDRLNTWLSSFSNLKTSIDELCPYDSEVPIRKLRIERDYTACIFEKVWQNEDEDHAILNEKWDQVWEQMTETLAIEATMDYLREDFWLNQVEARYNYQAYKPNWFNFEQALLK